MPITTESRGFRRPAGAGNACIPARTGFAGNAYTRRLMKRPMVQHGGARKDREDRKKDISRTDVYIINLKYTRLISQCAVRVGNSV